MGFNKICNLLSIFIITVFGAINEGLSKESKVIVLTDKTFDKHVLISKDLWLIEFYAPWCGICKQLMPVLDEASHQVEGKMKIGKIDATVETRVAEKYNINSYPTIFYARDGVLKEFQGGRSLNDYVAFAIRMNMEFLPKLEGKAEFEKLVDEHQVVFFLGMEKMNDGEQPNNFYNTFYEVSRKLQDIAIFAYSDDASLLQNFKRHVPFIVKLERGEENRFYESHSEIDNDLVSLTKWIETNRFPLFPILGANNFRAIAMNGNKMVITCISSKNSEGDKKLLDIMHRIASTSSSKLCPDSLNKFSFGYIDGMKFTSVVSKHLVYPDDLPTVFVLDLPNQIFYRKEGLLNNEESLVEFLEDISSGKQPSISTGFAGNLLRIQKLIKYYYPWSILVSIPLILMIYLLYSCIYNLFFGDMELEEGNYENRLSKKKN